MEDLFISRTSYRVQHTNFVLCVHLLSVHRSPSYAARIAAMSLTQLAIVHAFSQIDHCSKVSCLDTYITYILFIFLSVHANSAGVVQCLQPD